MAKLYLSEENLTLQSIYSIKIKQFLKNLVPSDDKIYLTVFKDLESLFPYLEKLFNEIIVQSAKSMEWHATTTPKACQERTLAYFSTFFNEEGKKKLDNLY
jgi:hypothetical protein